MSRDAIQTAVEALEEMTAVNKMLMNLIAYCVTTEEVIEGIDHKYDGFGVRAKTALDLLRAAKLNGEKGGG